MSRIITADQTGLYVKDWGSGQPVILIHGWPLSSDSWDDQTMALAQAGYRAIAYDRRGFGRSTQPWSGYDYDTLADDLAAVVEYTGAKDAVVVGFSMGGGEVARYMSRHNGKSVVKAVLVSASLPYRLKTSDNPLGTEQAVFDKTAQAINDDRPQFLAGFFEKFFAVTADAQPVSQELLEWARSVSMQASLKATLGCAKSFTTTDFRGELAAFKVPTLVIHGTNDQVVPIEASSRLTAKGIAHAVLLEYEGAPHGLLATHKARLTTDLLDFLKVCLIRYLPQTDLIFRLDFTYWFYSQFCEVCHANESNPVSGRFINAGLSSSIRQRGAVRKRLVWGALASGLALRTL